LIACNTAYRSVALTSVSLLLPEAEPVPLEDAVCERLMVCEGADSGRALGRQI